MHTNCFKTHSIVQHAFPYLYPINYCYSHKQKNPIISQTFLLTLKLKFNLYDTDIWQFNVILCSRLLFKITLAANDSSSLWLPAFVFSGISVFRVGQKSSCCRQTSICIVTMIRNVTHFSTRKENSILE